MTVKSPAWMFDGNVEYKLTIGLDVSKWAGKLIVPPILEARGLKKILLLTFLSVSHYCSHYKI